MLRWVLQAEEPEDMRGPLTPQGLLGSMVLAESVHLEASAKALSGGYIDPKLGGSLLGHWSLVRSVLCAQRCKSTKCS